MTLTFVKDIHVKTGRGVRNPLIAQLSADGFLDATEIGRGGFGVVYRCRQVELDRWVAVKVLTIDLDENRPRFEREQRAMAKLTAHPNIATVFQVGETHDGYPYIVMPYFQQSCVQTRIGRLGSLSPDDVLRLGVKIAGALESAHRAQIVHRDIKPANVLLTDYDEPVLTDFGIAHMSGGYQTQTGVFTGSPAFTAPEVFRGDEPGPATDVYSLGASLFCALTGHAPFERRGTEQVVAQVLRIASEPVPDLGDYGVAKDIAAVIASAVSKDPRDRPSAVEFGQALQNLQASNGLAVTGMALEGGVQFREQSHSSAPSARKAQSEPWPSVARSGGNLPAPLAGFVGREADSVDLGVLIATSRLVTLTGVGGVGKTSMAVKAAREQVPNFHDGVWLVAADELNDGSLFAGAVAGVLGILEQSGRPLVDIMVECLADWEALLVLDNCEHIIDAAAEVIETLLEGCPRLHILATSREILGVSGESVLPLSPLSYPDPDDLPTRGNLAKYDAVALFVERARTAQRDFTLTQQNAAAVARICAQLDGLPVAIDLAAARLRAMSVEQVADRLSDRFALLTRGKRGAPTRQQTLSWCFEWSYDRCTEPEQQLWARLSVFAGSFELDAAHDVCAADRSYDEVLDQLCALVDKSILLRSEDDGVVQFRLLATLREYGKTRIGTAEEYRQLQRNHLDWCRRLLEEGHAGWFSERQVGWIRRLRREMSNIQEALQFGLVDSPAMTLVMAADLRPLFISTGMLQKGREWLELALDATPAEPTRERLRAVVAVANIAVLQADWPAGATRAAEARDLLESLPDSVSRGRLDWCEAFSALLRGEVEEAQACAERGLTATDDFEVTAMNHQVMAWRFAITGDGARALGWAEKALALAETRHEVVIRFWMLSALAMSQGALGDTKTAERTTLEGLRLCQMIGDRWSGAQFLEAASWCAGEYDLRRAVVLMAASDAASRAAGAGSTATAWAGVFHAYWERRARKELTPAEYETAWNEGRSMSFEAAAAFAFTAL